MSKTKGVTVDRRESSELSVSLASEDEHRGVRSAIAASEELAAKHVVRSKPPLRMKRSAMSGAILIAQAEKE